MSYPKSPDKKIQKLSNLLTRFADQNGLEFCFGTPPDVEDLYPLDAFTYIGGLSLFLIEAQEQYEKVFNQKYSFLELMNGIGHQPKPLTQEQITQEANYLKNTNLTNHFPIGFIEQKEDTYFGFVPRILNHESFDFSIVSHITLYSLEEYVRVYKMKKELLINGKIPLDPLFDKAMSKINNKELIIQPKINTIISSTN